MGRLPTCILIYKSRGPLKKLRLGMQTLRLTPYYSPFPCQLPPSTLPSITAPTLMSVESSFSSAPLFRLPRSVSGFSHFSRNSLKFSCKGNLLRTMGVRAAVGSPSSDGPALKASTDAASAIDFLTLCHRLKTTKRKGWVNHGIKGAESIADHMYRMSLMALISGDIPGVNRERCIKIAIVHDIAEAIVGDITPSDGVPKAEKSKREQAALNEMCEILGGIGADEIKELWAEYENNSSIEASLVKDFDKVEMILQALEYEMAHGKVLDEFFISTAGKFQTDVGRRWAAEVTSRRNRRLRELDS